MAQKSKYLPKVDVNNKVFCMAPFVHMYITPSEPEEKICCQAHPHSLYKANFDLESRWTGSKIQSIRQQMTDNFEVATGEIAHLCSRCIEQEKRGDTSDRIMYKEKYDYVKPDIIKGNSFGSPLDLDLRPSNLCNLQCRMCNSSFSSQIQKEISKSNGLIDFMGQVEINVADWFTDENINFLLKSLHKGEWTRIKFLGGEPTIMPEVHRILDLLIEQKLTHVIIAITTNLTNVNKEFLNKLAKFEEITVQYQAAVKKKQKELKEAGKPQILRIDDKIKIMDELIKSGKIQKNESFLSKLGITDATIQKREHGGPVHSGESYLVGEKGPEVFIPKETGEVIANDDTQVFSMLLAANPQLQKVSKDRAMKILKAKFPEYFD